MCKLCWTLLVVLLIAVAAVGYKVLLGPATETAPDGRLVIPLAEQERGFVLAEMRAFLQSVQQITEALAVDDMPRVVVQARRVGIAAQHTVPPALIAKLPIAFKKLGFDTHAKFDELALDAEQLGEREHTMTQLGVLMQNCVACHSAYRIDPEGVAAE